MRRPQPLKVTRTEHSNHATTATKTCSIRGVGENPIAAKKRLHDFFALAASKPEAASLLQAYYRYHGNSQSD